MRPLRRPERFGIHGPSDAASALSSVRIVDSARSPSRPHVPPPRMEGRLYDLHLSADHPTRGSAGAGSAPGRERHAPYAHDGRPLVHVDGRAVDEVAEYSLPNRACARRNGDGAHLPRRTGGRASHAGDPTREVRGEQFGGGPAARTAEEAAGAAGPTARLAPPPPAPRGPESPPRENGKEPNPKPTP